MVAKPLDDGGVKGQASFMSFRLVGFGLGVAPLLVSAPAFGVTCDEPYFVHDPAPPSAVVLTSPGYPSGDLPLEGTLVPVLGTAADSEVDAAREEVPLMFADLEYGLGVGRPGEELSAGAWRFEPALPGTGAPVSFVVDAGLAEVPAAAPTFGEQEVISGYEIIYGSTVGVEQPVGYVRLTFEGAEPPFAVEIYEVTGGERVSAPDYSTYSADAVFEVGETYYNCESLYHGDANATYDVRVAAYSASGERGEWSEFERVVVPEAPEPKDEGGGGQGGALEDAEDYEDDGGCAVGRAPASGGFGWAALSAAALLFAGLRRRTVRV